MTKKRMAALFTVLCSLVLMLSLTASAALTRKEASSIAKKAVVKGVKMVSAEHDNDDHEWDFTFTGKKKSYIKYEVSVSDQTGKVKELEWEDKTDDGSKKVILNAKNAKAKAKKVLKKALGKVTVKKTSKKKDDGLYYYKVTFTGKTFRGEAKVNPETGYVFNYEVKYK